VQHPGTFSVLLPNRRKLDLASRDDADAFVDAVGTDFISTSLTATDDQELIYVYMTMVSVSENASREKIAAGFSQSEFRTFIEYTRKTFKTLSTDRNWLRSGTVSQCHEMLIQTVASFSQHPSFFKIFHSEKGMEEVAKLYASRKKNDTPSQSVAQFILLLVQNALISLGKKGLSHEEAFCAVEKTGLLGQFIRCTAVNPQRAVEIVTCLQVCLQLVKKKLKSGTPTGDILNAVIAGKDGPISGKVKTALTKLQSLAGLSNNNDNYDVKSTGLKGCNHCNKIETLDGANKLMKCQRCKVAYYCNRECQVAHWKSHKKMCKKVGIANVGQSVHKTSERTMWAFIESNYFDIVKQVYKKTQEYNVSKEEVFVEIDFFNDAPALRNELKVWLTSDFLKGSSVANAPEWFRKDADKKDMARYLKEEYKRASSNDLLAVCRSGNGIVTVQLLRFPLADYKMGYQLLSDEAVDIIGREDYVRMVACLGQPITNRYFEKRSGLK
jgi:hypothetical protein